MLRRRVGLGGARGGWAEQACCGEAERALGFLQMLNSPAAVPHPASSLQYIGFALSLVPFAGMLLVLSAERDERNVAGVKF